MAKNSSDKNRLAIELISFGHPGDPVDPNSGTLANGVGHNGTIKEIQGSWFDVLVENLDSPITIVHNLYLNEPTYSLPSATVPNVNWLQFGYWHSGAGATVADSISCNYETNDIVTANSIQLRFYSGGARTVNAGNPIKVRLFLTRAV